MNPCAGSGPVSNDARVSANWPGRVRWPAVSTSAFLICGLMSGCAVETSAQDILIRGDASSCAACQLQLQRLATFGSGSGFRDPGVSEPNAVVRGADSLYYIVHAFDLTRLQVYDSAGRYVRSIGRAGSGPGEFVMIRHVRRDRRGLGVIDPRNARWTLLGYDGQVLRESPFPMNPRSIAVQQTGLIVATGQVSTRERVGYLYHVIDTTGTIMASFDEYPYRADAGAPQRVLAPASASTFWAAHATEYRLEEWRTDGSRIRTVSRTASWFPPHQSRRTYNQPQPQKPRLDWIHMDSTGLLWVFIRVQDDRFRDTQTGDLGFDGRLDRFYDTVVEILDLRRGRVLVSQRFDDFFSGFAAPDELVSYRVADDGTPLIDVWRVRLQR